MWIGVVIVVVVLICLWLCVIGSVDYFGVMFMGSCCDVLCVAVEFVFVVECAGVVEVVYELVVMIVDVRVMFGVMNVVLGVIVLLVDICGIDVVSMERVLEAIVGAAWEIVLRRGV